MQTKSKRNRQVGIISTRKVHQQPQSINNIQQIRDGKYPTFSKLNKLSVNNINLCQQTTTLHSQRTSIYNQYDQLIVDLERLNQQLTQRNQFLESDRSRLISQNIQLRRRLQNQEDKTSFNCMTINKTNKSNIFQVIDEDQEAYSHVYHRQNQNNHQIKDNSCNEAILEQSDLDIEGLNIKNHHYNDHNGIDDQFQFQGSLVNIQPLNLKKISSNCQSDQKTPCLNKHHSIIQCPCINIESSLRIFYLQLLQQPNNFIKFQQILKLQSDMQNPLLSIYKSDNRIWQGALTNFFDKIRIGQFENQIQIIQFINDNILIDMLLIQCLKTVICMEKSQLSLSEQGSQILFYSQSSKNQLKDHDVQRIFRGLANQFDMEFQQDKQNLQYRFYNLQNRHTQFNRQQDQMLLESRQTQKTLQLQEQQLEVQISLHPQPHLRQQQILKSRQQPLYRIRYDQHHKYYRVSVSIRANERQDYFEQDYNNSFCGQSNNMNSEEQYQQNQSDKYCININKNILKARDLNKQHKYQNNPNNYLYTNQNQQQNSILDSNSIMYNDKFK